MHGNGSVLSCSSLRSRVCSILPLARSLALELVDEIVHNDAQTILINDGSRCVDTCTVIVIITCLTIIEAEAYLAPLVFDALGSPLTCDACDMRAASFPLCSGLRGYSRRSTGSKHPLVLRAQYTPLPSSTAPNAYLGFSVHSVSLPFVAQLSCHDTLGQCLLSWR